MYIIYMIHYISLLELVKALYAIIVLMSKHTDVNKIKTSLHYVSQIKRELEYLLEKHNTNENTGSSNEIQ